MSEARARATLTVDEVASMLGIARGSAFRAVQCGEIPAIRIGRRLLVPADRLRRLLDGPPADSPAAVPKPR